MAAGEDQAQPFVGDFRGVGGTVGFVFFHQAHDLGLGGGVAFGLADAVDCGAAGDLQEPGLRVVGQARATPVDKRAGRGLLQGIFCQVEIAERSNKRRQKPPPIFAQDPGDLLAKIGGVDGHWSGNSTCMIGRNSTVPCLAVGISAAISMA